MPLNLTDNLGPKVDAQTGRWIPVSETYLTFQTTALTQARFITAQVSDLYLVRWFLECESIGLASAVIPRVDFFTHGVGAGKQVFQAGPAMATLNREATSSSWMMIRSASSEIFISTALTSTGGANPGRFHLYVGISRMP